MPEINIGVNNPPQPNKIETFDGKGNLTGTIGQEAFRFSGQENNPFNKLITQETAMIASIPQPDTSPSISAQKTKLKGRLRKFIMTVACATGMVAASPQLANADQSGAAAFEAASKILIEGIKATGESVAIGIDHSAQQRSNTLETPVYTGNTAAKIKYDRKMRDLKIKLEHKSITPEQYELGVSEAQEELELDDSAQTEKNQQAVRNNTINAGEISRRANIGTVGVQKNFWTESVRALTEAGKKAIGQ